MIYSTLLLLFGIYIGQEYPVVPSVRLMAFSVLRYLKETNEKIQNESDETSSSQSTLESLLKNFIKKQE
jgi:hypothetical protein